MCIICLARAAAEAADFNAEPQADTVVRDYTSLLSGSSINGVPGASAFYSFSFPTEVPAYLTSYSAEELATFRAYNDAQKEVARRAIEAFSAVSGITFFEVAPGEGDIKFMGFDMALLNPKAAAFAYYPSSGSNSLISSDVFMGHAYMDNFGILLHELGHALGLKHPFDDNPKLATDLDNFGNTVMSYTSGGFNRDALKGFDISALRHLYGDQTTKGSHVASWNWNATTLTLTQGGTDAGEKLFGIGGSDVIDGKGGDDVILGREGNDTLNGGAGNDTLNGGAGFDTLNGGAGDDRLSTEVVGATFRFNVDGGAGTDRLEITAGAFTGPRLSIADALAAGSVLIGVETVNIAFWGARQDVTAVGSAVRDEIYAGLGNDTLEGLAGDDYLYGYDGDDRAFGGEGRDSLWGGIGNDTLDGGIGDDSIYGDEGDDILIAGDGGDFLSGDKGNDRLEGGAGVDNLNGGEGDDILDGGADNDWLYANSGTDTVNGGEGNDTATFALDAFADSFDGGNGTDTIALTHSGATPLVMGPAGFASLGLTLTSVEGMQLTGGTGDDVLRIETGFQSGALSGGAGDDTLYGASLTGSVVLNGDAGNDTVHGGDGTQTISGGEGDDRLNGDGGNDMIYAGMGNDLADGGEGADTLYGDAGDDLLDGGGGNDTVQGGAGDDTLNAGAGDNYAFGGDGNDAIVAGDGRDYLTGDAGNDRIEAGGGGDNVYAGAGNDVIFGGEGNDYLSAGAGQEQVSAGGGNDTIDAEFDNLADLFYGGAGQDSLILTRTGTTAITMAAGGLTALGYTLRSIEIVNVTGGIGNDVLRVEDGFLTATLRGGDGADTIYGSNHLTGFGTLSGGAGNDIIYGGRGVHFVYGDAGADRFVYTAVNQSNGENRDQIEHFETGIDKIDLTAIALYDVRVVASGSSAYVYAISAEGRFELYVRQTAAIADLLLKTVAAAIVGTSGVDSLNGNANANFIKGESGNDVIQGQGGDDILDGGFGNDQLHGGAGNDSFYVDSQSDIVFEAAGGGTDTVIAGSNYYLFDNIERLFLDTGYGDRFGVGNALANTITGNAGRNLLLGGAGDDRVEGGGGDDQLFGEAGLDTLIGEAGVDYLAGGLGNDTLDGGLDADALYGEDGNDTLVGGAGFFTDTLVGGAGNDTLRGDSGDGDYDLLDGGAGDDNYDVDSYADLTFEAVGGGTDTVYATIDATGYYLYANVENLVLGGNTPFGVGNDLANRLTGSAGANWLLGGAGDDVLNGKGGNDVLFGESGADIFVFEVGTASDMIGDFAVAVDRINLSAFGFTTFAQVMAVTSENGGTSFITLGGGDFILLGGVTKSALGAANFILSGGSDLIDDLMPVIDDVAPDPAILFHAPGNDRSIATFDYV